MNYRLGKSVCSLKEFVAMLAEHVPDRYRRFLWIKASSCPAYFGSDFEKSHGNNFGSS
jgi:hypothetical protein